MFSALQCLDVPVHRGVRWGFVSNCLLLELKEKEENCFYKTEAIDQIRVNRQVSLEQYVFPYMSCMWDAAVAIRSAQQFLSEQFNCT